MIFWKRIKAVINDLWYPRSVTVGKPVETQELAKRLARESTVAPADVHAVFRALPEVMADFMKESRAIHIEVSVGFVTISSPPKRGFLPRRR